MAGIKGKTGRRPRLKELEHHEILKLSTDIIKEYLKNPKVPLIEKVPIAANFYAKTIPKDINLGGQEDNIIRAIVNFCDIEDDIEDDA